MPNITQGEHEHEMIIMTRDVSGTGVAAFEERLYRTVRYDSDDRCTELDFSLVRDRLSLKKTFPTPSVCTNMMK